MAQTLLYPAGEPQKQVTVNFILIFLIFVLGSTNKLLKNIIPMHSMAKCNANLYNRVTAHMICGGNPGEDTCQGDSGGPLIAIVENDIGTQKYTLIGVTSWGYGCGEVNKPGVYAEVADYINWIKQYM